MKIPCILGGLLRVQEFREDWQKPAHLKAKSNVHEHASATSPTFLHRHHALLDRAGHLKHHRLKEICFQIQEILVMPRWTVARDNHVGINCPNILRLLAFWLRGGVK